LQLKRKESGNRANRFGNVLGPLRNPELFAP
jgi:hypothetical protein